MSIFKGRLDSSNEFKVNDDVRGVHVIGVDSNPSYWAFETGETTPTKWYVWIASDDTFRMGNTKPTSSNEATTGNTISGITTSGASKALDNLGTTAVNADIIFNDNINLSIGASADMTIDYDGTDIEIAFAAATVVNFGQTNPSDLVLWGDGGSSNVEWDASVDELIFQDNAVLVFGGVRGTNDGIEIYFDGTDDLWIDAVTADDNINFGATIDTDVVFHGTTADSDLIWESNDDALWAYDDVKIGFGDGKDMYFQFVAAGTLSLLQTVALTGELCIGVDDHGIDVTFFSDATGNSIIWDASAESLIFEDTVIRIDGANSNYTFGISTSSLVISATDHADSLLIFGTSVTDGLDVTFMGESSGDHMKWLASGTFTLTDVPLTLTGADNSGTLLTVTGIDAGGDSDSVTITHRGDGSALKISGTTDTAPTALIELVPVAATTTAAIWVDGDTNGWNGADVTGMVHIANDIALAHIGASLLYVDGGGAGAKASAQGHLARFVNTGTAQAGAVMVEFAAKDVTEYAIDVSAGLVEVAEHIHAKGYEYNVVDRTATDAGGGTAVVVAGEQFLNVDVTTADDGDILQLPAGKQGMIIYVYNKDAAQEFEIEPYGNETLNGGGAGVGMALAEDELAQLICTTDGIWVGAILDTAGGWTAMT